MATTVLVRPATAALTALGETAQLTAEVRDQNGQVMTGAAVGWTSSDASVAAVDASGRVTAAANGSATITATAGSASGSAAATVAQVVSAVTVSPAADTLLAFGDTVGLVAEATDANGHAVAASEFSWASSDTLVARVDASGQVTAAGNGSATVTATAGSASGSAAVTVVQVVSAVTVSPAADTLLAFGDTLRLVPEATDANGHAVAASEFSWASSDTLVARVDASGLVESVADGAAVVTATASEVTGAAELSVVGTAPPTITYLDGAGNPATDSSSITDHRIKVSFDERVSFLSSERYEALTPSFARRMIELNANNTNTLTGVFGFDVEVGVENDQSFFLVTPNASYPPGQYSVRVKNYVATDQAATILNSSIAERYLSFIDRDYSSFSTPTIDVLCDSAASGYFQLAYEDGRQDCVRVPQVVFTFTPRGGREMIESTFDPTLTVKIYFDSEVVYLSEPGEWRDIAREDILEMVEISVKPEYGARGVDHVSMDGAIGPDLVSVSNVGGRTVITIKSPYDIADGREGIYGFHVPYNVIVGNFATRADVSAIAASSSVSTYLEDTATYYRGTHGGLYKPTSCDMEYSQPSASFDQYGDQHGDIEGIESFVYNADMIDALSSQPEDGAIADAMIDVDQTHLAKSDPGTRHVIDLAFITSDVLFENASGDWRTYFDEQVIRRLDKMFQYSGVNVEFRVSLVAPFSEFRQYLYCDLPSMDNLVMPSGSLGYTAVISELIPIIRKQYPVDLFVVMPSTGGGYASIGDGLRYFPVSARWSSSVMVRAFPDFFDMSGGDRKLRVEAFKFGNILAHEIGHSLRLDHDVDNLMWNGRSVEGLRTTIWWTNVTTFAYGYGGNRSDEPIGTLMSYPRFDQRIPLFSADKRILRSELCDIVEGIGTLDGEYCSASDPEPDRLIKIGGPYKVGTFVDASEALQYTVGIVARYGDVGVAPLDLATVSNAISAAEMTKSRN
ncbi:MAG: Ig-like domain-containing protein [Gemmatimonadetes bacterium]|nr:Ig-like domain-containing protein [Gemmatimonadota bacterium]